MSSTEQSDMSRIIKTFLHNLNYLSIITKKVEYGFSNASALYESAYEFGRHIHFQPDFRQSFTDEDKKLFLEFFPTGLAELAGYTPGLVNNIDESDLNVARSRRSQLWFMKNELLDLYKEISGNELSAQIQNALNDLRSSDSILEYKISNWTRPDYYEAEDNPEDVPNLNGVPESHDWWTDEHRERWKNAA